MASNNPFLEEGDDGSLEAMTTRKDTAFDRIRASTGLDVEEWFAQLRTVGDQLQAKRKEIAALRAQRTRLEARYGSIGNGMSHWDHERKTLLAELESTHRADAAKAEEEYAALTADKKKTAPKPPKVTEGSADAYTHAHPRYKQFLTESFGEREDYLKYRAEIDGLYAEVEHLQGVQTYLVQRLRINEEAVRHDRSLANLGG